MHVTLDMSKSEYNLYITLTQTHNTSTSKTMKHDMYNVIISIQW